MKGLGIWGFECFKLLIVEMRKGCNRNFNVVILGVLVFSVFQALLSLII